MSFFACCFAPQRQFDPDANRPKEIVKVKLEVPQLGITLSFLNNFIAENGGVGAFQGLTTENVWKKFVQEKVSEAKASYCEVLYKEKTAGVGQADVLLTHHWSFPFLDVVKLLEKSLVEKPNAVIWMDLFSFTQSSIQNVDYDFWLTSLKALFPKISQYVFMLPVWSDKPLPALTTNTWSCYEVYHGISAGKAVQFAVSPLEKKNLIRDLLVDTTTKLSNIINQIDFNKTSFRDKGMMARMKQDIADSVFATENNNNTNSNISTTAAATDAADAIKTPDTTTSSAGINKLQATLGVWLKEEVIRLMQIELDETEDKPYPPEEELENGNDTDGNGIYSTASLDSQNLQRMTSLDLATITEENENEEKEEEMRGKTPTLEVEEVAVTVVTEINTTEIETANVGDNVTTNEEEEKVQYPTEEKGTIASNNFEQPTMPFELADNAEALSAIKVEEPFPDETNETTTASEFLAENVIDNTIVTEENVSNVTVEEEKHENNNEIMADNTHCDDIPSESNHIKKEEIVKMEPEESKASKYITLQEEETNEQNCQKEGNIPCVTTEKELTAQEIAEQTVHDIVQAITDNGNVNETIDTLSAVEVNVTRDNLKTEAAETVVVSEEDVIEIDAVFGEEKKEGYRREEEEAFSKNLAQEQQEKEGQEAEMKRLAEEEAEAIRVVEEELQRLAEEELVRLAAAEEMKRLAEEEAAQQRRDEEVRRQLAEEEALRIAEVTRRQEENEENTSLSLLEEVLGEVVQEVAEDVGQERFDKNALRIALAEILRSLSRYEQAERLLQETFQDRLRRYGRVHPDSLTVLHLLGVLFDDQAKYDQAELYFSDAFKKRKAVLGPNHEDTVSSMYALAVLYRTTKKFDKALPLYEKCYKVRRATLGEEHQQTLSMQYNLALMYQSLKQYRLATPLYSDCLQMRRHTLGETHPQTLMCMYNLAVNYFSQGKFDLAEQFYLECLDKRRKTLGDDHVDTLNTMNNLAALYHQVGQEEHAAVYYAECLDRRTKTLGAEHVATIRTRNNLEKLKQSHPEIVEAVLKANEPEKEVKEEDIENKEKDEHDFGKEEENTKKQENEMAKKDVSESETADSIPVTFTVVEESSSSKKKKWF